MQIKESAITTDRWGRARAPEDVKEISKMITLIALAAMAIICADVALIAWLGPVFLACPYPLLAPCGLALVAINLLSASEYRSALRNRLSHDPSDGVVMFERGK